MKTAKRILIFSAVNIAMVLTISIALSASGIHARISGDSIDLPMLAGFCLIYGFSAALISLALSRSMAKWMMGVRVIDPMTSGPHELALAHRVHELSRNAGLEVMPEVGIYESPDLNAFATGPTRNRALVAVSTGLLESMDRKELDGVLAHEVAHIANGDMVTMTLIQGVMNAFVMFLARIVAWFAGQFVAEEKRPLVQFGITLVLETGLGLLGMMVVAYFSRQREFRADAGGSSLAGQNSMVAALEALKRTQPHTSEESENEAQAPAFASLKISGRTEGFMQLFSTHPPLDERIARLRGA